MRVEDLGAEAEEEGIAQFLFQEDMEQAVRRAGSRVPGPTEYPRAPGQPQLSVGVALARPRQLPDLLIHGILANLRQQVVLARDPSSRTRAAAWTAAGEYGVGGWPPSGRACPTRSGSSWTPTWP